MKLLSTVLFICLVFIANAQKEVEWLSIEEAYAKTKVDPKPILVDVYTHWCGWCKKMDQNTYSNANVIKFINENFYPVKFNAEQKESVVLDTNVYKFIAQGRRGYHELAAALMNGKMSYPTTIFLDGNFNMIQPVPGYLDVKAIEPILIYLGEGKYKTTPWADFQATFEHTF